MGSVGTGKYQHSLNCGGGFIVHPIRARRRKLSKYTIHNLTTSQNTNTSCMLLFARISNIGYRIYVLY